MANNPLLTTASKRLLEQRAQYEQWLTKLDWAANKAPDAVRTKVRATTRCGCAA